MTLEGLCGMFEVVCVLRFFSPRSLGGSEKTTAPKEGRET